jgi:signal transduction histidine kinase
VCRRKDGTQFHAEGRGTAFVYQGEPRILSILRDITERVEAERAVQEERQRLSRELHDSVSQALYSIALGVKTARVQVDRDPAGVAESLDFILGQAERGLAEMRALIFELRPEALEQEGLAVALRKQADAIQTRHRIQVETTLGDEPEVPLPVKEALYRIAQEALHNTVKHAGAQNVQVSLACLNGGIALEIRDDGKGFDPSGSFPGHLGLHSMRERATGLGGTLAVESAAGRGTLIRVQIPIGESVPAARGLEQTS